MSIFVQFLLLFIFVIDFSIAKNLTTIKCNDKDFEVVFSKLISIGEPDRRYPENIAEIPQFCSETNELLRRFEEHNKRCLKATMKNFLGIMTYTIKMQIKRLCAKKRSNRVISLLQAAPCINRHNSKIGKCLDHMSNAFTGIKLVSDQTKMPHICCQFVELGDCFRGVMVSNGCAAQLPILMEQMHAIMGNYMDSTCGEYNAETDKCQKLGPPPKPKNKVIKNKFIKNLVDIFDSIK